jgi:translocation and assembly module TamB
MTRFATAFLAIALWVFSFAATGFAQDVTEEAERSGLIAYVEDTISTPGMQIRLNGINGALSSDVSFQSITIADETGIWLTVQNPRLIWSRSALLRGRLEVESLTAESIDFPRLGEGEPAPASPEATPFALPELPVAINLQKLSVPLVRIGEPVFGLAAELSVDGAISLDGGALETDLAIERLDGPGGSFEAKIGYANESQQLALDVSLNEPADGLIANMLNLDGRPPVALRVTGDAPLSDLDVDIGFEVDGRDILEGNVTLNRQSEGLLIEADLGGPLSSIMAEEYAELLGTDTQLNAEFLLADNGQKILRDLRLNGGALQLDAKARVEADGFVSLIGANGRITPANGRSLVLPGEGSSRTTIGPSILFIDYDAENNRIWNARIIADNVVTAGLEIGRSSILANGTVETEGDGGKPEIAFALSGGLQAITAQDEALATALGNSLDIKSSGLWQSGSPLQFTELDLVGDNVVIKSTGQFEDLVFDGQVGLQAMDLSAFSALAGRELSGSAGLVTTGKVEPVTGAFDINLNGVFNGLKIGTDAADKLLIGQTTLSGGVKRGQDGLTFNRLNVTNNQFQTLLDGRYASDFANLLARIDLRDLGTLAENTTGRAIISAELKGQKPEDQETPFDLDASIEVPSGRLAGKAARNVALSFDGTYGTDLKGTLAGAGELGGEPVSLSGQVDVNENKIRIDDLLAEIGATIIRADITQERKSGLVDGAASVRSRDISSVAALALTEASGGLDADVVLSPQSDATQAAMVSASASDLRVGDNRISAATIKAEIADLFGSPSVEATLDGQNITAGGTQIRRVSGNASTSGQTTNFDIEADLAQNNARIAARGNVVQAVTSTQVNLDSLDVRSSIADARLQSPTSITLQGGQTNIAPTRLSVGSGSVTLAGSVGDTININAAISSLPLAIANAIQPALGLAGTLNGDVRVTGSTSSPTASFDISGSGVSASQLASNGISPVQLDVSGAFEGSANTVRLNRLSVSNSQNIQVSGSGTIPLTGGGLNVNAQGTAPLAIAERFLASRGTRLDGTARFNVSASGSIAAPQMGGSVTLAGATISDPLSNLRLEGVNLSAGLQGDQLSINSLSANLASGGSISGSGTVGLAASMPANISVTLSNAQYSDGETFSTEASGQLRVTGSLAADPLLSGQLSLGETNITVPESFASSGELLDVTHVDPDLPTRRTLDRIESVTPAPTPNSRPSILQLDVTINAPSRIFVRGRGLDAELGGRITVRGPVNSLSPVGNFNLIRGRLSIVGQRIDLNQGTITLAGDLDPILNFVASTQSGDTTAFINIRGRASDLQVTFTSSPELPEDEVLSRIIFDREIGELSPVQIAKLASIAAELTGGNSPGLVDSVRSGLGLDDLDVVQDDDGNAAVRAGKYISDNVYLGVQAGQETEATINLDITENLTTRGSVKSSGETSLGIFFERDY